MSALIIGLDKQTLQLAKKVVPPAWWRDLSAIISITGKGKHYHQLLISSHYGTYYPRLHIVILNLKKIQRSSEVALKKFISELNLDAETKRKLSRLLYSSMKLYYLIHELRHHYQTLHHQRLSERDAYYWADKLYKEACKNTNVILEKQV